MRTAIAQWLPDYAATAAQEATIRHVRDVTGAKTLGFYLYEGRILLTLNKRKEARLIPRIFNDLLGRGERIAIYDAMNRNPIVFRPGDFFSEAEYLSRYLLQYKGKAKHPNAFGRGGRRN